MAGSNTRPDANRDGGVKLIVGLGNPGVEYQFTPHNLGFLAIDRIANEHGVEVRNRQCRALTARAVIGSETVLLAKPETFMNLSGVSVRELASKYEIRPEEDLIVIQDELDFPLGRLRIHTRRGSAGQLPRIQDRRWNELLAGAFSQDAAQGCGPGARYCGRSSESNFDRRPRCGDESLQSQAGKMKD